jgi:hypothetical protein
MHFWVQTLVGFTIAFQGINKYKARYILHVSSTLGHVSHACLYKFILFLNFALLSFLGNNFSWLRILVKGNQVLCECM